MFFLKSFLVIKNVMLKIVITACECLRFPPCFCFPYERGFKILIALTACLMLIVETSISKNLCKSYKDIKKI